jgi:uncharacterized protein YuzE
MKIKYDTEADAVYVYLRDKPYAFGRELDDERRIDYAADNTPIGIELLDVSYKVNLTGLPSSQELLNTLASEGIECYYGLTLKHDNTWTYYTGTSMVDMGRDTEDEPIEAYDAVVYLSEELNWEIPKGLRTSKERLGWMVGKEEVTA